MRLFTCFLFSILLLGLFGCAQNNKSNKEPIIQNGLFICRLNNSIIYSNTEEEEGENPLYSIYSLDPRTKINSLIDSLVASGCCIKTSDSTLAFSKFDKLYLWNSNTRERDSFLQSNLFKEIIAVSFNRDLKKLILFDFDREKEILKLRVFDEFNNNIFNQNIEYNKVEMEGIFPEIKAVKGFFVFFMQGKLYVLDMHMQIPKLMLISDKCDGFALVEDIGILFYTFFSDEKTTGNIIFYEGWRINDIDKILNDKIFNCAFSNLFTVQIDGEFKPVYIICGVPYIFSKLKWDKLTDIVVYRDDKLVVRFPNGVLVNKRDCFEWFVQTE